MIIRKNQNKNKGKIVSTMNLTVKFNEFAGNMYIYNFVELINSIDDTCLRNLFVHLSYTKICGDNRGQMQK